MDKGYTGKILRVNLSQNKITVEEPEESFYRRYYGGVGFISYFLLKEVPPGVDALSPENKLIFALGPVSGVTISGGGRNSVGAKSPMTDAFGKAEVGGFTGAEIKRAGFDAIIVEGRAERPVYLWVHDGEAEIKDARHLWGKPTKETQETIREELGDRLIRISSIGPAGERLVRFACVINDLKDAAGRSGMGAVMGSKNLKAVAVRGTKSPNLANPDKVMNLTRFMAKNVMTLARSFHEYGTGAGLAGGNAQGNLPVHNFREGWFDEAQQISGETLKDTIRVGMESCYGCAVRCKKVVESKEEYMIDRAYGGPEYEALGALGSTCGVGNLRAVCKANELCNAYGMDSISAGVTVAFAMECYENGIISKADAGGVELTWGNHAALVQMIEKIAMRQDVGDILAEGTRKAAQRLGRGAEAFSIQAKGVEVPMHEPRLKQGIGLAYSVTSHGADHMVGIHDTAYVADGPGLQGVKAFGHIDPLPANDLSPAKVAIFRDVNRWRMFQDCLVLCFFVPWSYDQVAEMVQGVTGWNTSVYEGLRVGERAVNLSRVFNMREGLTAADDKLPDRFHTPTRKGALKETAIDREALNKAIHTYYNLSSWTDAGVPTQEKLQELGIGWAYDELKRGKGPLAGK